MEPIESLGFATIDHHRALRQGFPEVMYGAGKTPEQICEIALRIVVARRRRARDAHRRGRRATRFVPRFRTSKLNALGANGIRRGRNRAPRGTGTVAVVTAGTSDLPVAEEAAVTLAALGNCVARMTDVGVAGIHRVLAQA